MDGFARRSIVDPWAMSQFHFDPKTYLSMIRADVARYDELQEQTTHASLDVSATTILELGTGTGETAKRVLSSHRAVSGKRTDSAESRLRPTRPP